jgi:YbbR domain-containing protein
MKNIGLKLISLFLAIVVWFFVSAPRREPSSQRAFAASLSLVSLSRQYIITTEVPAQVSVRLRARRPDLDSISSRTLEASVDLSWVGRPGEATFTLRPQHLNVPRDVEVVSIDPNKIRFRVEQVRQRTVAVRPFVDGSPPPGFVVGSATASPDRVLISGPATQILAMTEVGTERIIMTGRTATFVQNVAVVSDSPFVRVIAPLTTQVTVPVLAEFGPNQPVPETGMTGETSTAATETEGGNTDQ